MSRWIVIAAIAALLSACGPTEMEQTCSRWASCLANRSCPVGRLATVCLVNGDRPCETGLTCSAPAPSYLGVCTRACSTDSDCREFSDPACVNGACYPRCRTLPLNARCDSRGDFFCYQVLGQQICLPPNC